MDTLPVTVLKLNTPALITLTARLPHTHKGFYSSRVAVLGAAKGRNLIRAFSHLITLDLSEASRVALKEPLLIQRELINEYLAQFL